MKEAAGEANLTVVTVILIGVVLAIVGPLIANIMTTTKERGCCLDAGGYYENGTCGGTYDTAAYNRCMND